MRSELSNGWAIEFTKSIHMYCHSLRDTKNNSTFNVPCEDTPAGFVGIWPYELKLDDTGYQGLLSALREWASGTGINYRLYKTSDTFESNDASY